MFINQVLLHKTYHKFVECLKRSHKPKKGDGKNKKDKDTGDESIKKEEDPQMLNC